MTQTLPSLIETPRCIMRPFELGDLEDLCRLYGDPEVMTGRKIGVQTKEQTAGHLAEAVTLWRQRGFGLYAVRAVDTGAFMGECGFRPYAPDHPNVIELSYGLRPAFWGKGLATEVARAMIDAGFACDLCAILFAHTQAANAASLRVLEKLGFTRTVEYEPAIPDHLARCVMTRLYWLQQSENGRM